MYGGGHNHQPRPSRQTICCFQIVVASSVVERLLIDEEGSQRVLCHYWAQDQLGVAGMEPSVTFIAVAVV